jgi:phage terminase large subunit
MEINVEANFPPIFAPIDEPHRYKVMYGGRGSAKSWTVARELLIRGYEDKIRVLCTRELQRSIKTSVHSLLKGQIETLGISALY